MAGLPPDTAYCEIHPASPLVHGHCWLCSGAHQGERDRSAGRGFNDLFRKRRRKPKPSLIEDLEELEEEEPEVAAAAERYDQVVKQIVGRATL